MIKIEDLKEIGIKIYNALFEEKKKVVIDDIDYPIKKFSIGVKYLDLFGYRFIEQNWKKPSEWGKKAREGHKIMWIIRGRTYLAQIMDGKYIDLKKQ